MDVNWEKILKKEAHSFVLNLGFSTSYNLDKGFTNSQLYKANTFGLSPNLRLYYDYGELLSIKPSYSFNYSSTRYSNISRASVLNTFYNIKIETTNKWLKNWVFGNDLGYSYNSNISPGFKKDFYLWNISLSYEFTKDMSFKVKVYDLLDQNQSASRYITPTAVIDSENTVLKRYAMFSLLNKSQNFETK